MHRVDRYARGYCAGWPVVGRSFSERHSRQDLYYYDGRRKKSRGTRIRWVCVSVENGAVESTSGILFLRKNGIFVVITFRVTSPSEFTDFTGKPRFDSITRYCIGGDTVFIPSTIIGGRTVDYW